MRKRAYFDQSHASLCPNPSWLVTEPKAIFSAQTMEISFIRHTVMRYAVLWSYEPCATLIRRPTDWSGDANRLTDGLALLNPQSERYPCAENVDPDERGQELIGEPTPIFVVILIKYLEPPFNEFELTPLEARENKLWICAGLIRSVGFKLIKRMFFL